MNNELENDFEKALQEYIYLLEKELEEVVPIAYAHGWRSNRAEQGQIVRDKIGRLFALKNIKAP